MCSTKDFHLGIRLALDLSYEYITCQIFHVY